MAYIDVSGLTGITLLAGIDPVTRDMYLSAATVGAEVNPIDIYKEMRICRRLDESLRPYNVFLTAKGFDQKTSKPTYTERYVICMSGTRIVPYDVTHQITITGTIITDDGQEGIDCFDRSPLTPTTVVDINYVPKQVEVIVVAGGSGLDAEQDLKLTEIHSGVTRVVHIDKTEIAYGDGSPSSPFNTVAAAVGYANTKGIRVLQIRNTCILDADIEDFEIYGIAHPTIDFNNRSVAGADFHNVSISGTSTGQANYRECNVLDGTSGLNGVYFNCALSGDLTMQVGAYVIIAQDFSGIPGTSRPSVSMANSSLAQLAFRSWSGGIEIRDMVAGAALTVELDAGECRFAASCVGGDAHVRGTGFFENLGTVVPVTRALVHPGMDVNVATMNDATVYGDGTSGDKWRGTA